MTFAKVACGGEVVSSLRSLVPSGVPDDIHWELKGDECVAVRVPGTTVLDLGPELDPSVIPAVSVGVE